MTVIAAVQFANGDEFWMWLFLGALVLVALSFWRFHQTRQQADAPSSRVTFLQTGDNPRDFHVTGNVIGGGPPGLGYPAVQTMLHARLQQGVRLMSEFTDLDDSGQRAALGSWAERVRQDLNRALTPLEAEPWLRAEAVTEATTPRVQLGARMDVLRDFLAET